jgi:subtilisin family serine protease
MVVRHLSSATRAVAPRSAKSSIACAEFPAKPVRFRRARPTSPEGAPSSSPMGKQGCRQRQHERARLVLGLLVVALLASIALAGESRAQSVSEDENVLVRFAPGTDSAERAAARQAAGAEFEESLPLRRLQVVEPRLGRSTNEVIERLERSDDVLYAEPDLTRTAFVVPNDPFFGELWGLDNTGQSVNSQAGGTADADIDATEAWDRTTGSAAVTVGILDTGVAYAHPDLAPNIWVNPGESGLGRETNGIDDDVNGYVDDWHGWDWSGNNSAAPDDNDPADENWHGTHVAGTVGARGNNGTSVTGVAWHVSLVPLRVLNSAGQGLVSDLIEGYGYARRQGLRIVNASLGGAGGSDAERDALAAASNTLFVVAAGNGGTDQLGDNNDTTPTYPCSYNLPNVICVAATDSKDQLASFSNYGSTSVDLAAPGVQIHSTIPPATRAWAGGTSMATPHVSGAAALEMARFPTASVAGIRAALLQSVDAKPSLAGKTVTGGRLNVFRALGGIPVPPAPSGGSTPTPPPTPRGGPAVDRQPPTVVVVPRGRLKLQHGVRVRTRCSEACGLRQDLVLGARAARRVGIHWASARVVGRVRGRLGRAGAITVRLKLKASARRRLKRTHTLRLELRTRAVDRAGNTAVIRRSIRLYAH